jgi:hypothetical protein
LNVVLFSAASSHPMSGALLEVSLGMGCIARFLMDPMVPKTACALRFLY